MTADTTFALEHIEGGAGCYDLWLQAVSWPSGRAHRAPEAVASPRCWPFRSRFVSKKRARKRGNLYMIDNLAHECTRTHATRPGHTPERQLWSATDNVRLPCRFIGQQCTCRWSATTVSPCIQISDEIISSPGHLKFTLTLRSNQASSPMTLRLRRGGKEVEKGVDRPQVAGGKSSGGV